MDWLQAWWQLRQTWTFFHHAYWCGWSLYSGVAGAWSQRSYAVAYAVAQASPVASFRPQGA